MHRPEEEATQLVNGSAGGSSAAATPGSPADRTCHSAGRCSGRFRSALGRPVEVSGCREAQCQWHVRITARRGRRAHLSVDGEGKVPGAAAVQTHVGLLHSLALEADLQGGPASWEPTASTTVTTRRLLAAFTLASHEHTSCPL